MRIPREPLVFGSMDGTVSALGIISILTLTHAGPAAVFAGAFGGGLAGFPGMASGQWKSDPDSGLVAALVCGAATTAGAVLPAIPYLLTSGWRAYAVACVIGAAVAALITWLAPGRGMASLAQTYGVLLAAVALCVAGGFIPL